MNLLSWLCQKSIWRNYNDFRFTL